MMASSTDRNPDSTYSDDLKKIKGIGRVKEQWFRDAFQVYTFQDLASLSADAIATRLKTDGQSASLSEIENWLEQARNLAKKITSESASDSNIVLDESTVLEQPEPIVEQDLNQLKESSDKLISNDVFSELLEETDVMPEEGAIASDQLNSVLKIEDWTTDTACLIEFQSRFAKETGSEQRIVLHHLEDNTVDTLHTIDQGQWQQWLLDHLGYGAELKAASLTSPSVKPLQVKAVQPSQSTVTLLMDDAIPLAGSIKSKEPFSLEVTFQTSGMSAIDGVDLPLKCTTQLYARNRSSKDVIPLGCKEFPTWSQQSIYKIVLPKLTLSHPGAYRLQILALLQGLSATPGCFEIPVLNVV
jgi:hypothetical protein